MYDDDNYYEDDLYERDDYEGDCDDYEGDCDFLLEQQELEDFEQADEYFNHYDYNE
jgi:hypothetical protein